MPSQNQPNKQRQQMDRYLESQGLLNYQTKGMSQSQIAAKFKAAGVGVNQNWFTQNYKGAPQGQQQGPNFEPPKARGQAVPFNANPNGFTTMPNFGTPQNPTPPIAYEFVQNGLAVKVKLPQPVRTPGTGATNAQALRGETNWTDIFVDERKSILKDPTFYKDNKITQYPMWMQSQIIADPSFDWTQVPKWQRPYFELSSRPAAMGAVQGGIMALGASGPVGAVAAAGAGAVLGAFAGWSGYDQNKEAWQQGDNKFTWNAQQIKDAGKGAFGYLNLLAEFAEKSIGTTAQVISAASDPNKKVVDYLNKDTFNSSASFFEAITPALQAAAQTGKGRLEWTDAVRVLTPALFEGGAIIDLLRNPEKYKGEERYLGAALPVELSQSWTERLDAARAEIASGRNYREVATEFQTGIMAQIGDMAGQGIADPLNAFGRVTSGAGKLISDATGNKIAAEAFTNTDGLREASLKYKTLVQTGEAAKIDPTFDAAKLNTFERWVAGVNKEGQVKAGGVLSGGRGLLDPTPTSNKAADFVRMLGTETPQSRAETGATMFSRNVGQIISMFTTPEEAVGYIKRIAGGDNTAWRDMGSAIGNSPEWYTIQPALKNFVTTKLEGIQKAWETGAVNRDALNRIADVLGEKPGQLLDDWAARGTHEQDFARIIERAKQAGTPEAKALLADVDAKNFTAATLQQIVDIFHGEGSLPYDPAQWKYMMYSELTDHFQTWAADKLALDKSPEAKSAFFRTVGILKAAQSVLLLGANPGYAIQNGLSGMVHLAATGIYGSMTPKQMGDWVARWETPIPRVDEGVGMGGIVDVKKSSAISDAGKGTGPLTDVKQALGKISRGMPMSKLSSWFESRNSTRGYVTAMRQFWGNSWRRGVGFREMPKELTGVIRQMGIDPNTIYAAIEAGVNQKEIEAALFGQYQGVKAQSLIHDAAKAAGVTAADAADMLNKIGITDTLDTYLAKADTPEKVTAAFGRAERQVQDWLDMRTAEELKGRAEDVKNRVGMEGAAAGLDVAHRANNEFIDAWLDHYARFGDLFEGLDAIDPSMRNKAFEEAYRQSDENFRRVYARHGANYQGIFDVWGLSGDADATRVLQSISETNVAMKAAYDFMRAERRGLFENLDEAQITPTAEQWATSTKRIDAAFKKAFDTKHNAEVRQGQALAAIYEKLHGPAAGEAARLWWDDVTKFSEQIVKDEQDFRKSIDRARSMGADRDQIAAAKKKYYSEKKIGMIAELERLNQEGIARLERVIKNGGSADPTATPAPTSPTPTEPNAPTNKAPTAKQKREAEAAEVRAMERAAEERRIAEQQARRQAEASVWDIAEKYWGSGGNYSRTTLQDRFSLIGALKKPEYGGDPTLTGLTDPRITADFVTQVMEARTLAKQAEAEAKSPTLTKRADKVAGKIVRVGDNTNILRAIQQIGGLRMDLAKDLTGEKKPRTMPGVFQVKGINIDMMAMRLAEYGYPIDLNNPDDIGGMGQTAELLRRAISGDRILPMHANLEAEIEAKAANEAIRQQAIIDAEPPFDSDAWHASMKEASQAADLNRIAELMGEVPEDMNGAAHDTDGETYSEYTSRTWDDVAYRIEQETQAETIAQAKTEADLATADAERRADAVTTRVLLKEQFAGIFGEEQAQTYMELSDTIAQWYERTTGESADEFYSRYYEDVKRSAEADIDGGLKQEYEDSGMGDLRRALDGYDEGDLTIDDVINQVEGIIRDNDFPEDILKIEKAIEDYRESQRQDMQEWAGRGDSSNDAEMLFSMIERYVGDEGVLYQAEGQGNVKGAVVFNADGIRATIHAFESADFSTLVHENAHVFRRVLKDVAERTGNTQTIKDLATIEEWAGVKDGNWTVGAEEKFARGFEKYIATGDAPTPRLKKAFETFGKWMTSIYRTITGSAIDVKISDEVKGVFDRMLGAETKDATVKADDVLYQRNKAQVSAAQFDMFAPKPEQADIFAPQADAGTAGGLLPGMQEATGMMFDVQPGSGQLTRMEAPTARSIYEIDPARTATDGTGTALSKGDVVEDADGKRHNVSGANMRGKIVTEAGRILEPKEVKRVARQDSLFQKAEPIDTPAFKNWFGNSKVVDENGRPLVVYHGTDTAGITEFNTNATNRLTNEIGAYFTPDQDYALQYGNRTYPVYVSLKNPFIGESKPAEGGARFGFFTLNAKEELIAQGYDGIITKPNGKTEEVVAFYPEQIKSVNNRGTFDPNNPNILFQQADQPFGTYEDASQFPPHSAAMDEGYSQHVRPLLDAMKQIARDQVQSKPLDGATRDMSPEGQAALRKYMKQVQADMAGTKNAATKWGESQRDFAMLNYNKRYGIDRYIETAYPYQFFYTRSFMTWAARALDKPAIFSNYARMKKQMDRYERDIPERLRNKIKINAPWMPDWMGDALYIDPISSLFTPLNYLKPFERKLQDTNYQNIEAERILQEWAADGMVSQSDIVQAVKTREGKTWERAFAEAQLRRESDLNNPMDFLNTMLGPAWYLTTPYKLLTGKGAQVGSTPILNTTRAIDTVTQGTWAEPVGDVLGMIGKPEEMLRQKLNMPEFGEYGDYYIDRQLSNMVADGLISSDEAQVAMIERRGADFETARERVKMELAMRVPTASALLAGLTAENFGQGVARAAMTAPASLFGAGLLPAGELEYRNLKQEWNEAWKLKDQGDDQAITNFFDEHPEYEAYLAKGKKPEERLRSFLAGQIWDGYMSLGTTDKKQFTAEVGDVFKQSFLDSETRSIETLNVDQLAQWAQMLDRKVPDVPATQPTLTNPAPSINYFAPEITRVTDKYFTDRAKLFPNYYAYQQQYYMIPYTDKSKRLAYLTKNPEYAEYLKWQEGYYNKYPELKPVFNGQVFKRVDVSGWPPALADYVSAYAYTGSRLPNGAFKALQQEWISQGKPMGDMQTWLDSQVVPFMLYGQ